MYRKVLPVNSEVLVHLKNFESTAGCMKADHEALAFSEKRGAYNQIRVVVVNPRD
jgi:hypothetical protein